MLGCTTAASLRVRCEKVMGNSLDLGDRFNIAALRSPPSERGRRLSIALHSDADIAGKLSLISKPLDSPVTVGSGGFADALIITSYGAVVPTVGEGTALTMSRDDRVLNSGSIVGGAGVVGNQFDTSGPGGSGAAVSGGVLLNKGLIAGGIGGGSKYGHPGSGGIAVELSGGVIINQGTVQAGSSGSGLLSANGGDGVTQSAGIFRNEGLIAGGTGNGFGSYNGDGVDLDGGTLSNAGTLIGGDSLQSTNAVRGTMGGAGVLISGGSVANAGLIDGGTGGYASGYFYRVIITGYAGTGGAGVLLSNGFASNRGTIEGGRGGNGNYLGISGTGGAGAVVSGGALTNVGSIFGGTGGESTYINGAGGTGVSLSGGILVNAGTIEGGLPGANTQGESATGGVGAYVTGGILIDRGGLIAGRDGADAIRFGSNAGTLELYAGVQFMGNVAANAGAQDDLLLAGSNGGTLTGLGSNYTGFSGLVVAAGSQWTLSGTNQFSGAVNDLGTLITAGPTTLSGTVIGTGTLSIGAGGTLALQSGASATDTVSFADIGLLDLANPLEFLSAIVGFQSGDAMDLLNTQVTSDSYANNTLTLTDNGATVASLHLTGSYTASDFVLASDHQGGTVISHH
jgi:hypothetical protein